MSVRNFAAIVVGSYEISMKIFDISSGGKIKEIDHIRQRVELGTDTYATGRISYPLVNEVCRILNEFVTIMKTYRVKDYMAYGTSAIRETHNRMIILDQIAQRTGIVLSVLSNSEQRFLDYKSIAFKGEDFSRIIEKGTAIVDIGGGSLQISLFDKDSLVATQNMRLGVLRMRERLLKLNASPEKYEELLEEMVGAQLGVFKRMYLKDRQIQNIILVDDYVSVVMQRRLESSQQNGYADVESLNRFMDRLRSKNTSEIAQLLRIPDEAAFLLFVSAVITKKILMTIGAELLWAPGVTLCDGIAYEYAERNKIFKPEHDFEQDIIACARNISKRYMGSRKRGETLEHITLTIFDSMRKIHGLGKRERLLLRIAAILHDCGKYMSMINVGECSYSIIMSTEIIGLSHKERAIIANIVKYNHLDFDYFEEQGIIEELDAVSYLTISKLTAILRVANGLDRSHKQKFKNIKTTLKDNQLILTVDTLEDITLERGLFAGKADFFEEVYSIRPVIKQKKTF